MRKRFSRVPTFIGTALITLFVSGPVFCQTALNDQSSTLSRANYDSGFGKRWFGGPRSLRFGDRESRGAMHVAGSGSIRKETLIISGDTRSFFVYEPPGGAHEKRPLVLAFHGGGGKAEVMDKLTGGITAVADKEGFLVVFPQGANKHWNDGREITRSRYDDVAFTSALIDKVVREHHADPRRVYSTGISNGGFFSQYLALKIPDKVAAVASVAATVPDLWSDMPPTRAVPVMFVLGTDDPLVPFQGGRLGGMFFNRGTCISWQQAIKFWTDANHVSEKPSMTKLPTTDPADGTEVVAQGYGSNSLNEVLVYIIKGGGHTWPQGWQYLPASLVGTTCRQFNANQAIWQFFSHHQLGQS